MKKTLTSLLGSAAIIAGMSGCAGIDSQFGEISTSNARLRNNYGAIEHQIKYTRDKGNMEEQLAGPFYLMSAEGSSEKYPNIFLLNTSDAYVSVSEGVRKPVAKDDNSRGYVLARKMNGDKNINTITLQYNRTERNQKNENGIATTNYKEKDDIRDSLPRIEFINPLTRERYEYIRFEFNDGTASDIDSDLKQMALIPIELAKPRERRYHPNNEVELIFDEETTPIYEFSPLTWGEFKKDFQNEQEDKKDEDKEDKKVIGYRNTNYQN